MPLNHALDQHCPEPMLQDSGNRSQAASSFELRYQYGLTTDEVRNDSAVELRMVSLEWMARMTNNL